MPFTCTISVSGLQFLIHIYIYKKHKKNPTYLPIMNALKSCGSCGQLSEIYLGSWGNSQVILVLFVALGQLDDHLLKPCVMTHQIHVVELLDFALVCLKSTKRDLKCCNQCSHHNKKFIDVRIVAIVIQSSVLSVDSFRFIFLNLDLCPLDHIALKAVFLFNSY